MLIAASGFATSQTAETLPSSSGGPSSLATANSPASSAFDQLLHHQINSSLSSISTQQSNPDTTSGHSAFTTNSFGSESHSSLFSATGTFGASTNSASESYSFIAVSSLLASNQSQVMTSPVSTAEPASKSNRSNSTATTDGAFTELSAAAKQISDWQAEQVLLNSLTNELADASAPGNEFASISSRLALQNLVMSNSGTLADTLPTTVESLSAEQSLTVHEFSVETTFVAPKTTDNPVIEAEPGTPSNRASGVPTERPPTAQPTHDAASSSSSVMAVSSPTNTAVASKEVALAAEVSNAILNQLEEEPSVAVTTVRIQLDRSDLGSISLFLSINNNRVTVRIVAQDELARQLIDSQMDDLRQALDESGVECSEFEVVCDATHDQSSSRKRTPQRLLGLGLSATAVNSEPDSVVVEPASAFKRFNFVA